MINFDFSFNLPPECLLDSRQLVFLSNSGPALILIGLLAISYMNSKMTTEIARRAAEPEKERTEKARDQAEVQMTVVFLFLYSTSIRQGAKLVLVADPGFKGFALCIGITLMALAIGMLARFYRKVEKYRTLLRQSVTVVPTSEKDRLQVTLREQLIMLTERYKKTCPRWQFITWSRQLLLVLLSMQMDIVYHNTDESLNTWRVAIAVICALVMVTNAALTWTYLPYYFTVRGQMHR